MKTAAEIYKEIKNEFLLGHHSSDVNLKCTTLEDVAIYAMKLYAEQALDTAAKTIVDDDPLVYEYDCIPCNDYVANEILSLKDQLK